MDLPQFTRLIRFVIPLVLFVYSSLLSCSTVLGKILTITGLAILLHFFVDYGIGRYLRKNRETTPISKTKIEAIKFTINAVTVVTGVLLGFISNQNESSCPENIISIALVSYCLGIFFGLINITLFTSGIAREYTYTSREYTYTSEDGLNQQEMTFYEIEMKPVIFYIMSLLLNLQFMCLLAGIVTTAFLHL